MHAAEEKKKEMHQKERENWEENQKRGLEWDGRMHRKDFNSPGLSIFAPQPHNLLDYIFHIINKPDSLLQYAKGN